MRRGATTPGRIHPAGGFFRILKTLKAAGAAALLGLSAAQAQDLSELTIVRTFELNRIEPQFSGGDLRSANVLESLVGTDREGRFVPGLAESWRVAENGLSWTFVLREGARFHDGSPVDGAAVESSFELQTPNAQFYRNVPVKEVSSDGREVTFALEAPFGALLAFILDPTVPVLAPSSFNAEGEIVGVVGTGPYRILEADLPRSLTLERFEDYWGAPGVFAQVRLETASNPATRANIALSGDADVVQEIPPSSVARIDASNAARIQKLVVPRHVMIMVNAAKPQFETPELRRALSLAVDRRALARAALGDADLAATQYVPPILPEWHFPDLEPFAFDLEEANRILDEAGWRRGPDGIREKDGLRYGGLLRTFPQRAYLPIIAEILQDQLARIGYELKIAVGDSALITEAQLDGSLDLGLGIRTMMYQMPDPIVRLNVDFANDSIPNGASGATGWRSQEIRDAFAAYMATSDEVERAEARRTIMRILHEELPVIPLAWVAENYAVSRRIEHFAIDPVMQNWRLNEIVPAR